MNQSRWRSTQWTTLSRSGNEVPEIRRNKDAGTTRLSPRSPNLQYLSFLHQAPTQLIFESQSTNTFKPHSIHTSPHKPLKMYKSLSLAALFFGLALAVPAPQGYPTTYPGYGGGGYGGGATKTVTETVAPTPVCVSLCPHSIPASKYDR